MTYAADAKLRPAAGADRSLDLSGPELAKRLGNCGQSAFSLRTPAGLVGPAVVSPNGRRIANNAAHLLSPLSVS